jgi:ubiE/COQ5 methyltransferase family
VEPRFGRLYASAVLRPLAEQMVDALGVQPGETVCDLMCDGGTLGVALGTAVASEGAVVLVDTDAALLQTALSNVCETGCAASTQVAIGGAFALADLSCDRVGSLCTFGFWEGVSLLDTAERVTRPTGRAVLLAWDAALPPLHEVALVDALRDVAGIHSEFLARCLAGPDPVRSARWEPVTLHDVVRYDGIGHYWAAMVGDRPVAAELVRESDAALREIRTGCQRALAACTAADGTMRIPVRATLWCFRPEASG